MRLLGGCVVALLLGACGSSSKPAASSSPPTAASGSGTTVTGGTGTAVTGGSGTTAASGGLSATCPTPATVNAALGTNVGAPTTTQNPFGVTCAYKGTGVVPIRIVFQKDTPSTFAAGEAAVPTATKVAGLGDAAYTSGGFLAVLKGNTALRITAPLSTSAQVEALAHQIVG